MSNLSWNWYWSESAGSSWREYLRQRSIVGAINSGTGAAADYLGSCISSQTLDIVGSVESLQASMEADFAGVNRGLEDIERSVTEVRFALQYLNETFTWGFNSMLATMGGMQTTFNELLKIAKTPAQTAAYEQFEIARDAYRKGLLPECLDALKFAIDGVPGVSPGYKIEWRFHQLRGLVLLGSFDNHDPTLVNPVEAEQSFILAARYARQDFAKDAAQALLSAGWAAYVQAEGRKEKLTEALAHTELAVNLDPNLAEALFQQAKFEMALGQPDAALLHLKRAADFGGMFVAKAAADGDFRPYDIRLRDFLIALRQEKANQVQELVKPVAEKLRPIAQKHRHVADHPVVRRIIAFAEGKKSADLLALADFVHYGFMKDVADISKIEVELEREKLASDVVIEKRRVAIEKERLEAENLAAVAREKAEKKKKDAEAVAQSALKLIIIAIVGLFLSWAGFAGVTGGTPGEHLFAFVFGGVGLICLVRGTIKLLAWRK